MNSSFTPESSSMRYRPQEIEVTKSNPFSNDKLGRESFIRAATELIKTIQEPFVIALDAPWGSGKSTTLRMLEPHLEAEGVVAISFNAWEVDYATDPLVPLVSTLHERLNDLCKTTDSPSRVNVKEFKRIGGAIAKQTLIAGVKIVSAGLIDAGKVQQEFGEAVAGAMKDASANIASDIIDEFQKEKESAHEFKRLLEDLVKVARAAHMNRTSTEDAEANNSTEKTYPPLVLLIDELDRCRPTFAISMLERIKHFFQVPGIVFMLAVDLDQLKASTHKIYGADLDAPEYLRRFIDLELRLPDSEMKNMIDSMLSNCGTDQFFDKRKSNRELSYDREHIVTTLSLLAMNYNLSARQVQRILSRLILVLRQTSEREFLDGPLIVFLLYLRLKNPGLLVDYFRVRATAADVMSYMNSSTSGKKSLYNSFSGKLIEAFLLFGHGGRSPYTKKYQDECIELFNKENNQLSAAEKRMIEVYEIYQNLGRNFRFKLDLQRIESRINLVTNGDFTEE